MKTAQCLLFLTATSICLAQQRQEPKLQPATGAVVRAFDTHNIVMFGEYHACKQEYDWLKSLVNTPEFADRVDDIVVEFGNSLFQKSVDEYVAGASVPIEQVQHAWRDVAGEFGPPPPMHAEFYKAVREANMKRHGKHPVRVVLGDPYVDWEKVKDREDLGPFIANRDSWYATVVREEVLAKNHRALLIMGSGHFLRRRGPGEIEKQLRAAGANPYLVAFGTNAVGSFDDLDQRFNTWTAPSIVDLQNTWVGDLPANPVTSGGIAPVSPQRMADVADAMLYLGPRDSLIQLGMPRSELEGTAYGKEIDRRLTIEVGRPLNFERYKDEAPLFERPRQGANAPMALGAPPKSIHDPLPPRPPSR